MWHRGPPSHGSIAPPQSLLLFSVLFGFWVANYVAFNGEVVRELAAQFLALAEKQGAIVPLMVGHRLTATSFLYTGDVARCRAHYDQAIALYDPAEHRPLAARFGQDPRVSATSLRSLALWMLGYPEAALFSYRGLMPAEITRPQTPSSMSLWRDLAPPTGVS